MSVLVDDLLAAKALIDTPEKWCRERHDDGNGRHCAMGAVIATTQASSQNSKRYEAVWLALSHALPPEWEGMVRGFNDNPDTTHNDVLALFDRAINVASAS